MTRDDGGEDDLPRRNLVSALAGLENGGSASDLSNVLTALSAWVRGPGDDDLRRAFVEWVRQVLPRGRFGGAALPEVRHLEGGRAMLADSIPKRPMRLDSADRLRGSPARFACPDMCIEHPGGRRR